MPDILHKYGIEMNNSGFSICPFHDEKTPSFKAYKGDKGFYCFGCGEHGDIISFVQKYFDLSFQKAMQKIDSDFGLNIICHEKRTYLERINGEKNIYELKKQKFNKISDINDRYWETFDKWKMIVDKIEKCKPKNQNEQPTDEFLSALQSISGAEYDLDIAEMRRSNG